MKKSLSRSLVGAILFLGISLLNLPFASAQSTDPLVVGPHIYKLLKENDRVRVLEISFQPGDKIDMHSHPDHLVYITSGGTLKLTHPDGTSQEMNGKAGDVIWIAAESHAAENTGTTEVKAIVVELKEKPGAK